MPDHPPGTEIIDVTGGPENRILAPTPSADPNQPLNWSVKRKAVHFIILELWVLITFATMCANVPCWQPMNIELGFSYDNLNNGYATQVVGLSLGTMLFVPLAIRYGSRSVCIATSIMTFVTAVWQAKMTTLPEMYVVNMISGLAGCVNEALVPMAISDLFFVHQRGTMNGLLLMSTLAGNYLGPVAAGYIAASQGWRWVWWWCTILQGAVTLLIIFFLEEINWSPPVLEGFQPTAPRSNIHDAENSGGDSEKPRMAKVISESSSPAQQLSSIPLKGKRQRFALITRSQGNGSYWWAVLSPYRHLIFPAVSFCALQYGLGIIGVAVLVTTQGNLYPLPPYSFGPIGVGNMNIPPAIGSLLGAVVGGPLSDYHILKIAKRRGGVYEPESRLWLFWVAGASTVAGFAMFGLTIAQGQPWMINAVGAGVIGFGFAASMDVVLTYTQDSYAHIIGEALIPITFVRNIPAAVLCYGLGPWTAAMGTYNVWVCLTCIAAAFVLLNLPMLVWGRHFRAKFAATYKAAVNYSGEGGMTPVNGDIRPYQ